MKRQCLANVTCDFCKTRSHATLACRTYTNFVKEHPLMSSRKNTPERFHNKLDVNLEVARRVELELRKWQRESGWRHSGLYCMNNPFEWQKLWKSIEHNCAIMNSDLEMEDQTPVVSDWFSGRCRVLFSLDFGWSWILPLCPTCGRYCKQGYCPKCLQSLDGIPQCLPYWLDGVSVGTDTRSYEYFSLCYDDPAPGQR